MLPKQRGESAGQQPSLLPAEGNAEKTVCKVSTCGRQVSVPGQWARRRKGALADGGAEQAVATVRCVCTAWHVLVLGSLQPHVDKEL